MTREAIKKMYIRVCRDSGFRMETAQAAHFAAKLLEISAIDVWLAMDFDSMDRIANGTHPCLTMERYA